jgi:hypothetical protein
MTIKQQKDIETTKFFIPDNVDWEETTPEDETKYLEYSEKGLHKEDIHPFYHEPHTRDGFNALIQGKRWRGIHVGLYEDGVLGGTTWYEEMVQELPRSVIEYMAKEMFQGIDKEIIYAVLQDNSD